MDTNADYGDYFLLRKKGGDSRYTPRLKIYEKRGDWDQYLDALY